MEAIQEKVPQLLLEFKVIVQPVTPQQPPIKKEPSKDKVTQLVIEYQETRNQFLLTEIQKLTKNLVWDTIRYYGVNNFNNVDMEDISLDCQSWVLLNTIGKFDRYRGVKFTTLYTWWLSSHIGSKQRQYMRRRDILETAPLDALLGEDHHVRHSGGKEYNGPVGNVENILSNGFNVNVKNRIYKYMSDLLGE